MGDTVYTTEEIASRVAPVAKKYHLAAVYLFGSYARGDATSDSDIDLLVDLTGSTVKGIIFGGLYADLEDALGKEIDLLTVASLAYPTEYNSEKQFNDTVLRERRMIYAAA